MGRYNLQHIDRGVIYLHVNNQMSDAEIEQLIQEHTASGKTVVLLRSGKYDMKNILRELIKTRLDA